MSDGEVIRGLSVSNPTAPWSNRIFSHLFVSLFPLKSETKKTNYIRRSRPRPGSFPKNQTSRLNIFLGGIPVSFNVPLFVSFLLFFIIFTFFSV